MQDETRHDRASEAAEPGRRTFLKTSLGAGFALAVQPVSAATVTTPTDGLTAGEVKVPSLGVEIPAYRAMPASGGPFPVMLVIQEIFGVHEYIKDVCRRFAKLGYYAIAPDLFARQGDATKADIPTIRTQIVPKVPDAQVMSDLDATTAFAAASGAADVARLASPASAGAAASSGSTPRTPDRLKAGVAFYGILGGAASPPSELKPRNPVDVAGALKAPVLGLYAGKDDNIPMPIIDQMQAELKAAGSPSRIEVFPDVPHGFHADYRPTYREDAATEAWAKAQAWFKANGVGVRRAERPFGPLLLEARPHSEMPLAPSVGLEGGGSGERLARRRCQAAAGTATRGRVPMNRAIIAAARQRSPAETKAEK